MGEWAEDAARAQAALARTGAELAADDEDGGCARRVCLHDLQIRGGEKQSLACVRREGRCGRGRRPHLLGDEERREAAEAAHEVDAELARARRQAERRDEVEVKAGRRKARARVDDDVRDVRGAAVLPAREGGARGALGQRRRVDAPEDCALTVDRLSKRALVEARVPRLDSAPRGDLLHEGEGLGRVAHLVRLQERRPEERSSGIRASSVQSPAGATTHDVHEHLQVALLLGNSCGDRGDDCAAPVGCSRHEGGGCVTSLAISR